LLEGEVVKGKHAAHDESPHSADEVLLLQPIPRQVLDEIHGREGSLLLHRLSDHGQSDPAIINSSIESKAIKEIKEAGGKQTDSPRGTPCRSRGVAFKWQSNGAQTSAFKQF